jgi:hypothetical protein
VRFDAFYAVAFRCASLFLCRLVLSPTQEKKRPGAQDSPQQCVTCVGRYKDTQSRKEGLIERPEASFLEKTKKGGGNGQEKGGNGQAGVTDSKIF